MMKKLKLRLRCENGQKCPLALRRRIKKAAVTVLVEEGVTQPCELSVLLTDGEGIRLINAEFRQVDRPTDVLSFPMGDMDMKTGRLLLGDMVLNIPQAEAQGAEFGHGAAHEISYLTVHSVLHLLGYDHVDEGPMKKEMRGREKLIMARLEPEGIQTES
ncbi:MAG: rRNA maturation RNase YbeY [Oscillospiraceae bacterium]|nr:rRNA maturation RNase YbeY [Oscillospiraceae bacterium]